MGGRLRLGFWNWFAARQAARHITRLYEKHLAEADVTSAQLSILVVLDEKRRASMSEMADALVMHRTTLLPAVKPLQRDRFLIATLGHGQRDPLPVCSS